MSRWRLGLEDGEHMGKTSMAAAACNKEGDVVVVVFLNARKAKGGDEEERLTLSLKV